MTAPATHHALQQLAQPLRRWSRAAWLTLALGSAILLLGAGAWLARLDWFSAPYWVLVAWGAALSAAGAAVCIGWLAQSRLSLARLALRFEELGAWRRGALTSLLDATAAGTSDALFAAADRSRAQELARHGAAAIEPIARPVRTQVLLSALVLSAGVLAIMSAGPTRVPAAALWHPRKAWEATVAPVTIGVASNLVDRGDSARFQVQATGRKAATLWLRAPGEAWRPRGVRLDSLGRAVVVVGPMETALFARVTSGRRSSDTILVRVRLPIFLAALTVTARYPAYLGLEDEPVPTDGDTLLLPAGTRLETRGEATVPLTRADWKRGAEAEPLRIAGVRFSGTFVPQHAGEYRLALETVNRAPIAGDTARLALRLVADSAPHIDIPVPGSDTLAPLSLMVPIVIDVRDDHGLGSVVLESRRISRLGLTDPARREPVALPAQRTDRAILTFTLDLNHRALLPGDTVRYFAVATDNAPRPRTARSREFVLRLPTMSEVRAAQRQATAALASRLDSAVAAGKRVERQTDDLAREQPRDTSGAGRGRESLSFEQAKRAENVARSQQQLLAEAEEVKAALDALRRSADAAGVADSAWQRQLEEIRTQLDRALSPELRERLAALQQSLKELDAARTKDALERLLEAQKQLREALERSQELFRRAALEGDLANLIRESRDLTREQRQWNDEIRRADSARAAVAEQLLATRTDSLGTALVRIAKDLTAEERADRAESAAAQVRQAAQQMRQAAQAMQQGQRAQARKQGEQAERTLQPIGDQLQQERQELQQDWRKETTAALDRALAETSHLADRQLRLPEQFRPGADRKGTALVEQAAIEEGVQKILDQMRQAAGKNALVSQQIATSLAAALQQMAGVRAALSSAVPNAREAVTQVGRALDGLNVAAYQMLRARNNVAGAASGSGLTEALEQMAQLAQQQGGLGAEGAGLLPMAGNGAIREQLRQLAAKQRALAEQLARLHGGGDMPGAGEMAEEAKEIARRLESGRLDRSIVERQERLFRRMLDAGRTLQGREEDEQKERQSMTATDDSVHLPPALRARLADDTGALRMPSWDDLQQLSPEERRLVVDYFRRLSEMRAR